MVNCSSLNFFSFFNPILFLLLEMSIVDKSGKKRPASTFEENGLIVGVGWVIDIID